MSTTYPTAAEIVQEVRPQLLVRTSQFLRKVSNLRPILRRKSEERPSGDLAYARAVQSMDLGSKAHTDIEMRAHHHSSDHSGDSGEDSPYSPPLRNSYSCNTLPEPLSSSTREIDGLPPVVAPAPVPIPLHVRAQTVPPQHPPGEHVTDAPNLSSTLTRQTLAPRLATLPPPMMAQYAAGGVARLTPSLVTRQPPMPLLKLPTLPPPSPSEPRTRPARPTARLRSLPALPMQGPSETDQDADHDNASLDEEEEEEAEGCGDGLVQDADSEESEDEDDGPSSPHTSIAVSSEGPSRYAAGPLSLSQVDNTRFSVSPADAGPHSSSQCTPRIHAQAGPSIDYFSSKPPEPPLSPSRTPRLSDFHPKENARAVDAAPQPRMVSLLDFPSGSPRPGLYHHASKSMVEMSVSKKEKGKMSSPKLPKSPRKPQALGIHIPSSTSEEDDHQSTAELPDDVITSPIFRRRRSLPAYELSSDPPPYPDPLFRRRAQMPSQPQEEDGRESLPRYSNYIYLAGIMPRKMEFTQPGVQAKDRKWRRVYCVLEGTCFRVFKCPPAASGVSAIEHWWENKVGVGDITSVNVSAVTASGFRVNAARRRNSDNRGRISKIMEDDARIQGFPAQERATEPQPRSRDPSPQHSPSKSMFGLTSRFLRRQRSKSFGLGVSSDSSSRLSIDSRLNSNNTRRLSHTSSRHSMDTVASRPSNASTVGTHITSYTSLTVPSPPSTSPVLCNDSGSRVSRSRLRSQSTHEIRNAAKSKEKESYTPDPNDLIHQYTLQHAESGLASDYLKRKNVVRVRMEGEQFLLQAKDIAAVIDWIEGIQMGTNVALDLDERPMPRGPIFPRRRRRRPRRPESTAGTTVRT